MNEIKFYTNYDDASILIIGGAGFVGSNLVKTLISGCKIKKITIVDNLLSSERISVPKHQKIEFVEGSITDFRVLSNLRDEYDYVFHLATFHGNQNSIYDPIRDHNNNALTTLMLFERLKTFKNTRKIVYSSAGCSVAKKTFENAIATTEDSPIEIFQDSPYSISKIIGDFYANFYFKQHSLPIVRARFQNVYGPGEILGAGDWRGTYATVWRNVIPTFIYKAINGVPLPLENKGRASRDFIFVEEICKGLMCCAISGNAGEVYNLGSGVETSIFELASIINEYTGNRSGIEFLPKRKWDNSGKRFASTEKAERELGFKSNIPLKEGIKITVDWTKQNIAFIERCIRKHDEHMIALN